MNIIANIRAALQGDPDPVAVSQGLTVQRRGRRLVYGGLPTHMQRWKRRQPDALDLAIMAAADTAAGGPVPVTFRAGLPKTTVSAV